MRELASRSTWRQAAGYLWLGLLRSRIGIAVLAEIAVAYSTPAVVAAYLSTRAPGTVWEQIAREGLAALTAVVGTVVVMIVTAHHARGVPIGIVPASLKAIPWVPRYVWTNVHTSVIFWAPVGSLILIGGWLETSLGLQGVSGKAVAALWWMVIALVALVMHTRTLLAPFFAIHGDLPGTLAALEAWRLSGRYFAICLSTLAIASLPMALPLLALAAIVVTVAPGTEKAAVVAAAPYAVWAGIQVVRTVLIPALCALYNDLWTAELRWRRAVGSPPVPRLARALLTLTRPLPSLWGSRRRPA